MQSKRLSALLGDPGRLHKPLGHWGDDVLRDLAKKSLAARSKFHAGIDAAEPPLDALVRLGRLLAIADAGRTLECAGPGLPEWLRYLFNDAVGASFWDADRENLRLQRPAWGIGLIVQLLAHDIEDEALALCCVFECDGDGWRVQPVLDAIVEPAEVASFMLAHRDAVLALPSRLSPSARALLLRRIGRDPSLCDAFDEFLMQGVADASKRVRAEAVKAADAIAEPRRLALLGAMLSRGDADVRARAADALARLAGTGARSVLLAALEGEQARAVKQVIGAAIARIDTAAIGAADGLPEPPPWSPIADSRLGEDALELLIANRNELLDRQRRAAAQAIECNGQNCWQSESLQRDVARLAKIDEEHARAVWRLLNREGQPQDMELAGDDDVYYFVTYQGRLEAMPGWGLGQALRWFGVTRRQRGGWRSFWDDHAVFAWIKAQPAGSVDLRALADVLLCNGFHLDDAAETALVANRSRPSSATVLAPSRIWPFFAEHQHFIDEGLGMTTASSRDVQRPAFDAAATLATLACFPRLPARWLNRVMELALGNERSLREPAQNLLAETPGIGQRVADALQHSQSEVRIEAARWLARRGDAAAIPALTAALDKEARETARAALLIALDALGDDLAKRLAPPLLLAEAKKVLKVRLPTALAWFDFNALPACRWRDGEPVDTLILRWWVVLACKLKEPGGNPLIAIYLGLLDHPSREALGNVVLQQFIVQDTRHPSLEAAIDFAQTEALGLWHRYQSIWRDARPGYEWYFKRFDKTQEQVFEECRQQRLGEYVGSAIGEKGVLALAAHAPAQAAVAQLQQYMRAHPLRRAQIEALLEALAAGDDPHVIQLLLSISRRHRTRSVKEKAHLLVLRIAERNRWTEDQLADRTIPSAGLDDEGRLELAYGERSFTLVLDGAMKLELRNAEGKVVKALPEPRQGDDAESIKEAKSLFTNAKRELKQVVELQTARLYDAMCGGRVWPHDEWQHSLRRHPIVGRMAQRLVWLEIDAEGHVGRSFRPVEDGSLIDVHDDEVELAASSGVRLAHAVLLDEAGAKAWLRHFKDYKLAPVMAQMTRRPPPVALIDAEGQPRREIDDRLGWLGDSVRLRTVFGKLGYVRSEQEGHGIFRHYVKELTSAGFVISIEFSGNMVIREDKVPAALMGLSFERLREPSWSERIAPLKDVPSVLLAEAHADYLATAEACDGFDPEWQKKTPWQ